MTKKNQMVYMSLIPLIIIIIIIGIAGYLLIGPEIKLPIFDKDPKITRLNGFPNNIPTDMQTDKIRKIITNEQELNEFLNTVDKSGLLNVKENVDFSKSFVIAVASENRNEADHKLKIKKVLKQEKDKKYVVQLFETLPGEGCEYEIEPHIAVDMAVISKTDWVIDFEKERQTIECNQ